MRIIENGKKGGKIHNFFMKLTWDEKPGMKRPLSILPCCRSVVLAGSKREIRCSRDKSWKKIWPSKKVVKTRWKWLIFHPGAFIWTISKSPNTDRRRKISRWWIREQKNTFTGQMTSYEGFDFLFCFIFFHFSALWGYKIDVSTFFGNYTICSLRWHEWLDLG